MCNWLSQIWRTLQHLSQRIWAAQLKPAQGSCVRNLEDCKDPGVLQGTTVRVPSDSAPLLALVQPPGLPCSRVRNDGQTSNANCAVIQLLVG